jgi:hypothetical protein
MESLSKTLMDVNPIRAALNNDELESPVIVLIPFDSESSPLMSQFSFSTEMWSIMLTYRKRLLSDFI